MRQEAMASRVVKAVDAMKAMEISEYTTRTVLKNLLKVYRSWEPIEEENYRLLADMICEYQVNQVEEERKKRKDIQLSNEAEPQPKRLNLMQVENRASRYSGHSHALWSDTPLRTPELQAREIQELSGSHTGRRVVKDEPDSSGLCPRGNQKVLQTSTREVVNESKPKLLWTHTSERVEENVSSSQTYPRLDITGLSHYNPSENRTESSSGSRQEWQRNKGKEHTSHEIASTETEAVSHRAKGKEAITNQNSLRENGAVPVSHRAKGKEAITNQNSLRENGAVPERAKGNEPGSHQNTLRETRVVSRRVSIGVSFKERTVEHGKVMIGNDLCSTPLAEHQSEPFISDYPQAELPIAIPPLNQYPAEKEDGEDGADGISNIGQNSGLALELSSTFDNSFSNFEISYCPLGEVKISLSCISSTGRPDIHMPSLDQVLKMAKGRCLKSHKIINPNFSLVELMEKLCQYFLGLTTIPPNDINTTQVGKFLKKQGPCTVIGSEGSHRILNHMEGGSSNSHTLALVQHHQFNLDGKRPPHNLDDIAKGEERVKIPVIQINSELYPPLFHYISQNTIFQNAHVNFSLARIGDEDSCSDCFGDCVASSVPCACARETGGVFAYTADGIVSKEFLDECILMRRDPPNHHLYYCKDCLLETSNNGLRKCKGHFLRKFIKECWSKCGCDKQCGNRVVQRGITRNLQVCFTSEGKGWGLQTVEDLPRGAFVCEYVGEILTNTELYYRNKESTGNEKHTYPVYLDADWGSEGILEDEEALCLDATMFGNVARFINHRCYDANLVEIPVEIETPDHHYYHVAFFTSRSVSASEELTWDYGIDFRDVDHPIKAFRCLCGSKYCRDMQLANCTA